jgi:hypothetical protein
MTDPNYTALLVVLDRSGSMIEIADSMSRALSALLKEQAGLPGLCTLDLVQFDHAAERVHHLADPATVEVKLTPRGGTALYDAVGIAVFDFDAYFRSLPDHARPSTVQVVVISDGEDTRSTEYSASTVRALVQAREAAGWQFTFLGAGLDAEEAAQDMGTARGNGIGFDRDANSVRYALAQTSRRMADGRRPKESMSSSRAGSLGAAGE